MKVERNTRISYYKKTVYKLNPNLINYSELNLMILTNNKKIFNYYNWSKLFNYQWVQILMCQPQLAEFCDWSKLNDIHWKLLLAYHPQFAEYRNENK